MQRKFALIKHAHGMADLTGFSIDTIADGETLVWDSATETFIPGAPSSGATGANPSAQVGTSAINGVATTYMRSDAAPALNLGISPTWSGTHTFSNAVTAAAFVPSSSSVPSNGMYLPAANTLAFASNTTLRGSVNSTGNWVLAAPSSGATLRIAGAYTEFGSSAGFIRGDIANTLALQNGTSGFVLRKSDNTSTLLSVSDAGNVTINAATSGDELTVNGSVVATSFAGDGSSITSVPYSSLTGTPTIPTLAHGTYTPTITAVANVTSSTSYVAQYLRVGNTVTVSGKVSIQATSAATTQFRISLPVASSFSNEEEAGGSLAHNTLSGRLYADVANDDIRGIFGATGASIFAMSFHFTYQVI